MRRKLLNILLGFSVMMATVAGGSAAVYAADFPIFGEACKNGGGNSSVCTDKNTPQTQTNNSIYGPNGILVKATDILLFVIGAAVSLVIVVSGVRYILANGDSGKISQAKEAIIYALVGLVIALLARTLIVFVVGNL